MLTAPDFSIPHARHAFFTRDIPESGHIYLHKHGKFEELESSLKYNRALAMNLLGYDGAELAIVRQIHGTEVVTVTDPWDIAHSPEADAMVTDRPGKVLGILTADCVPVLFADKANPIIGAAHAGWKGAKAGIIENTLTAMEALGSKRRDIAVAIGPCIQQSSYEIGSEFYDNFLAESKDNQRFFRQSTSSGHRMFDLPAYAIARLEKAGVTVIRNISRDTLSEEQHFFSFRRCTLRGEKYSANNLSVITLLP